MSEPVGIGPLEMVLGVSAIALVLALLYGLYRLGYRVGRAEGALQERERLQRT